MLTPPLTTVLVLGAIAGGFVVSLWRWKECYGYWIEKKSLQIRFREATVHCSLVPDSWRSRNDTEAV